MFTSSKAQSLSDPQGFIPWEPFAPQVHLPPPPPFHPRKHATPRRAPRGHKLDKAKAAVKEAAKRVRRTKILAEPCTIYVGNIGPDVDENALVAHFSSCGNILSARIHCCGGVAMTSKPPPASYHQNMRVRQYGIVTFESKPAAKKACTLGGTLRERELIVSVSISDLPEVQEKIKKRLEDYRAKMEPQDVRRARESALRSLQLDPTVLLDPRYEKQRKKLNRMRVWGFSLAEAIV